MISVGADVKGFSRRRAVSEEPATIHEASGDLVTNENSDTNSVILHSLHDFTVITLEFTEIAVDVSLILWLCQEKKPSK